MNTIIFQWVALIIAIEALTEIIVDSKIMLPLRNWLTKVNPGFLGELVKCGYCFSVWPSFPAAFILQGDIFGIFILDIFIKWMLLHRLSNVFHGVISRIFNRQPFHLVHQRISNPINNSVDVPED
jgi:hypothetical protein